MSSARRSLAALVALALAVTLAASACSSGKKGYNDATRRVVLEACNPGHQQALDPVCSCAYDRITKKYSYDEYLSLDAKLQNDPKDIPPDLVSLIVACTVEASDSSASGRSDSSS